MRKVSVREILDPLIGLPLWDIGRAATLEWFALGVERREVPMRDGKTKIVSEYSLHVECAWRIRKENRIIVGSGDRGYPAGDDPYKNLEEFESRGLGDNQLDERVARFLQHHAESNLVVRDAQADESGSFGLFLDDAYSLEVFPDNSFVGEHWRLFKPYSAEAHFVYTSSGLEQH